MKKAVFLKTILCIIFVYLLVFDTFGSDVIYSWRGNGKKIALTFDDGPHPIYTEKILEILEKYDVKATFFVIGQNVKYYPDALLNVFEHGHEIGNHTYTHRDLAALSASEVTNEIKKTENELDSLMLGEDVKLLRPPGGLFSDTVTKAISENKYKIVCWSIDTLDWAHTSAEKIFENVKKSVRGGDIILFHDYVSSPSPTPEALELVIPYLLSEGYEFVTVSELIGE